MATSKQSGGSRLPEYFVDSDSILSAKRAPARFSARPGSSVLEAKSVRISDQPVVVHGNAQSQIRVDTVREGSKITGIKIVCPCGRTAEMKVQYEN